MRCGEEVRKLAMTACKASKASKLAHEIEIAGRHTAEVMESSQAVIGDLGKTRHFWHFNQIHTIGEVVVKTVTVVLTYECQFEK